MVRTQRPLRWRVRGVRGTGRLLVVALAGAILLVGVPAAAAVPPVDPYQPYVRPVANCPGFVEQPGVKDFRDMVLSRMGGANYGIYACSGYEHEEGRAWDWGMNANNAAQAATVQRVLDWLLATDAAGNPHAMARRVGMAYIIWNRRVINLYRTPRTWHSYGPCTPNSSPSVCHTNHVHFAFAWAGARRQTTWFTTTPRPGDWYPGGQATPPEPGVEGVEGPVASVFKPGGNTEAYFTSADGRLRQLWYVPGQGWNGPIDLVPTGVRSFSVLYKPGGNTEVYYVTATGDVAIVWHVPGTGWVGPSTVGPGAQATELDTLYKPGGNTEVYYTNTAGDVGLVWYVPGAGWQGPTTVGAGARATDINAVYKPGGNTEVYFAGAAGDVGLVWYVPGAGWQGPTTVGAGARATEIDVVWKPGGNTEIYFVGAAGDVGLVWYVPGAGWQKPTTVGADARATDVSALYKPGGNTEIYFADTAGDVGLVWYAPGSGWQGPSTVGAGAQASNVSALYKPGGNTEVYFDRTAGGVGQVWYAHGIGWNGPITIP